MAITKIRIRWLVGALFAIAFAILSFIWTPYELIMEERLRMRPGLPAFNWWYEPPDIVRIKIYLFNITNAERYLSGQDAKLQLEEIGPLVFRDIITHSDPVFNDNSTLSYTFNRKPVWDPTLNTIDLNATITFPNLSVLLTASMFWDANYFVKKILNYAFTMTKSQLIVKKTIYEILYNNTDPFLDIAHVTLPSIAVVENIGLMPLTCPGYDNRMNVFMGTKFGHQRFFLIDKFNGSVNIPGRGSSCKYDIVNASNSIIYSQFLLKSSKAKYFNYLLCRNIFLTYQEEVYPQGVKAYRYVVTPDAYDRTQPPEDDCYKDSPILTDGLTDLSPCWFDFPVVGSFPHFLYGDPILKTYVDGLKPNVSKHESYAHFEPITGFIMDSRAIVQINLRIKPLKHFDKMFDKFSNKTIPAFILESSHDHIPNYLITFIRIVHLLPAIGTTLSVIILAVGLYCMWKLQISFLRKAQHQYTVAKVCEEDYRLELDEREERRLNSNVNSK